MSIYDWCQPYSTEAFAIADEKHSCSLCPPAELPEQKLSAAAFTRSSSSSAAISWASHFGGGHLTVSCKGQGTGQGGIGNRAAEPLTSKALGSRSS